MKITTFAVSLFTFVACGPGEANIYNESSALLFEPESCVIASGDTLNLGTAFTFEMYIQGTDTPTDSMGPILTFGSSLMLWTSPSATWLSEPSENPTTGILTGTSLYDGEKHHIAAIWSDEDLGGALYIDGQRFGTGQNIAAGAAIRVADELEIGCWMSGGHHFEGIIDEVRISTGVRYPTLFIPPTDALPYDDDTLALWHFDQGTGDSVLEEEDRFLGTAVGTTWTEGLTTPTVTDSVSETDEP